MSSLFGKAKRKKSSFVKKQSNSTSNDSNDSNGATSIHPEPNASKHQAKGKHRNHDHNQHINTFSDMDLIPPLQQTCHSLGYKTPTPVQKQIIPHLLQNTSTHILSLAPTGSGKTASFVLPILHHLSFDPYGIYCVILSPTRELAKQIYEQVLAFGSYSLRVKTSLVIGGMDMTQQSCELSNKPHFVVATPGRLGSLLRGPNPPVLRNVRYVVLDEADRLLNARSGFQADVAEVLLHGTTCAAVPSADRDESDENTKRRRRRNNCQTLLFSATLTRSLESLEEMAGAGLGRLPLKKFVVSEEGSDNDHRSKKRKKSEDDDSLSSSNDEEDGEDDEEEDNDETTSSSLSVPKIPAGLRQEYIFMPSHVRDAYLMTAIRHLMTNGGRKGGGQDHRRDGSGWNDTIAAGGVTTSIEAVNDNDDDGEERKKAKSAIIFVSSCERTALISGILTELGVNNVALHSLLTQNRRLASLAKFKSQHCRVMVATDVASRGLDIPTVDLVLNCELPRRAVDYIHRVGRTARAGRRGRAVSLVCERDVSLVHACEKMSGREMKKCEEVTDDLAVKILSSVTKAARLTKMKLADIGFDELVKKMKERKVRDKKLRQKSERAARKILKKNKAK